MEFLNLELNEKSIIKQVLNDKVYELVDLLNKNLPVTPRMFLRNYTSVVVDPPYLRVILNPEGVKVNDTNKFINGVDRFIAYRNQIFSDIGDRIEREGL